MTQRLIIAGGGLSGVLTAVAFAQNRPDVAVTLVEAGERLGGRHTWSFYDTDVEGAAKALIAPFVSHSWPGYDAQFPAFSRTFTTPYHSILSSDFHTVAMGILDDRVRLSARVAAMDPDGVTLEGGERIDGDAVIDATGPRELAGFALRWQKFYGREVRLARPHGLALPTIMDANVSQVDGYRFVYLLPFSADTLLIEDTYYAEGAAVDRTALSGRIDAYAAAHGWDIVEDLRDEEGALPLVLGGDFETMWNAAAPPDQPAPIGLRAGLFHTVTGYSLPASAKTAVALARLSGALSTARVREEVASLSREHFRRSSYDRLLNRFLFLAGRPEHRYRILQRFHRMPQPLIERFYAGRLPPGDKVRILFGKSPVPYLDAIRAIPESAALAR